MGPMLHPLAFEHAVLSDKLTFEQMLLQLRKPPLLQRDGQMYCMISRWRPDIGPRTGNTVSVFHGVVRPRSNRRRV